MPADCPVGMKLAAGANAAVEQISFRSQSASGARPRLDVPSGVLATADQVINRTQFVALRYVFWQILLQKSPSSHPISRP